MKQKLIPIFAWILGFSIGFLSGAFIGLILGGTFLGGFDIYASTGFEGYELSAYAGEIIGAIVLSIIAYKVAVKLVNNSNNNG